MTRAISNSVPLSRVIDGFVLACQGRKLSLHTISDYSVTLKRFLVYTGDVPFKEIEARKVSAFLASLPWSNKTILNYYIGLAALWTWAVREEYASKHIIRFVQKPKPQKKAIHPLSPVEVRAIASCIKRNQERDYSIILVLLDTGIRASELCGLTRDDVDLKEKNLRVVGKGNKERYVPFSARTASAIFRLMTVEEGERLYRFDRTSLARQVRAIGERAGVKGVYPHRFRHTFAIMYLRNGGDPYTLQAILGHTTMDMVKTYLKLAQIDLDTAHKRASPVDKLGI